MHNKKIYNLIKNACKNQSGSTLVEMIVCFALLGIFMACAASLIATIANVYYDVKGETYARQVSDIVLERVSSEIDGALAGESATIGEGDGAEIVALPYIDSDKTSIELYDKKNTHVRLYSEDQKMKIQYYEVRYTIDGQPDITRAEDEYAATTWLLDDSFYNGFKVEELKFYKKGDLTDDIDTNYGLDGLNNMSDYGDDVVLVLLKLYHERYGTYYTYRFVKMYNFSDN